MNADMAQTLTAATSLVGAVGVIVVAVLQYLTHNTVKDVKSTGENTAVAVTMKNGHTLGETVEGVAEQVNATPAAIFTEPTAPSS